MNKLLGILLLGLLGCATPQPKSATATTAAPTAQFGVTGAKITQINTQYKFVVLDFTSRVMPSVGTKLPIYRDNARVGEIQITEPVRANFATADILSGDLRVNDEAR